MTRTIAVCTQKGGVGKTTTVSNLAPAWASLGRRVLAVDWDPQFALTRRFGVDPSGIATIYDVFAKGADLTSVIVPDVEVGVDLVPAERNLAGIEISLAAEIRREGYLRRALTGLEDYDVVLIDCPPNLGLLTVNALCAADEALVPIDMMSGDALNGAEELVATVEQLESDAPRAVTLLRNRVFGGSRQVYQAISAELAVPPLSDLPLAEAEIPARDAFEKQAIRHRPLAAARPDHRGALAFLALARELDAVAVPA